MGAKIFESMSASSEVSECVVIELIHGTAVQSEIAGDVLVVVAGSSQGNFGSNTVSSQGSHTDLVLIHEPGDVVCIVLFILAQSSHPNSSV